MKDDKKTKKQDEEKAADTENKAFIEKLEECESKYKRALADYQNLEKRSLEERKEWVRLANKELILKILPVLDTLILASGHIKDQGLALSIKQFSDILKKEGVEKVETLGKSFNPETMEVVQTQEGEEGKVLEEIRAGYTLGGQTLRVAMVKVGREE